VRESTSPAGHPEHSGSQDGFTLLEVVCVLAIVAMLAAVIAPVLPRGTSRPRMESYALAMAALLKADRNAAVRTGRTIDTHIEATSRLVRSGVTGRSIRVPDDVAVNALLPARCGGAAATAGIRFFSSGMSCGGNITLSRQGIGYEIRVNWLTGGVDIVSLATS
jgi:general secretion pathway protein H